MHAMKHKPGCPCPVCDERRRRRRLRRVADPTNLPGVWIFKRGKTMADFEKARSGDSVSSKKRGKP